jgi:hypothetical protein
MCEMNQPENRMSDAMRRLNAMAPSGAPPALGDRLKDEFRRHHARRKRNLASRFSLLAACLVAGVALSILLLRPRASNTRAVLQVPKAVPVESVSAGLTGPAVPRPKAQEVRAPVRTRENPFAEADRFVTLPTFDPAIPIDHLEMVRLDLPGRALQLVGFAVSEELADRRVVADVLLAQDGTPYALRLVRSSENKEQ